MATMRSDIDGNTQTIAEKTTDRYRRREADSAHRLLDTKIQFNRESTIRIEHTLESIDAKLDTVTALINKHSAGSNKFSPWVHHE